MITICLFFINDWKNLKNLLLEQWKRKRKSKNLLIEGFEFIYPKKKDQGKHKARPEKTVAERAKLVR